ncbi:MAG: N-acetylmuramoyl-L-alanine amidase [Clostridiales bacterium]|jgi:N-acetylmuramoyl-L-alanine amidase|nr:N-acetylmuramoyl-L-alanine amidase [Clostridiales bacterium]
MRNLKGFFGVVLAAVMVVSGTFAVSAAGTEIDDVYVIPEDGESAYSPNISKARDISPAPLTEQEHPDTRIIHIDIPADPGNHDFVIHSASSIRKVEKQLMADNRIVLDFSTASNELEDQYNINHPVVQRIRAGQLTPQTTRVVFDLKAGASFVVLLSDDRRSLTVRFVQNTITRIYFHGEGNTDIIEITGDYCPILSIAPLAGTNQIIVDMPISTMGQPAKYITDMSFVKIVHASQPDINTARLTLESYGMAGISVEYSGNTAILRLSPATYDNIYYTGDKTLSLKKDPNYPISANDLLREDHYAFGQFVFELPGQYSGWLGWGEYYINDEYLNEILIKTGDNGNTRLVFEQKRVLAYEFWEDSEYIYIKPVHPKEKYDKIVVLDPGHGGNASGASANGLVEKNLNLDVSSRLINLIERDGSVKVYATRITDRNVDLYDRPVWASDIGDIFISIHMNAMGGGNTSTNGTEVYWYPHSNDSRLGYSGKDMAEIFQRNLVSDLGTRNLGVKSNRFIVIKNTTIPAILCEIGFLTNRAEAARLGNANFRQSTAESLYRSVLEVFAAYTPRR